LTGFQHRCPQEIFRGYESYRHVNRINPTEEIFCAYLKGKYKAYLKLQGTVGEVSEYERLLSMQLNAVQVTSSIALHPNMAGSNQAGDHVSDSTIGEPHVLRQLLLRRILIFGEENQQQLSWRQDLIFLKYVSDSFKVRQDEIAAQLRDPASEFFLDPADYKTPAAYEDAIRVELEERDYYVEKNVFWAPALARWKTLQDSAKLPAGTEITVKNGKRARSARSSRQ